MALALGVDTGGTYTDAVLIRDETDVIASAKSLTTRHDLAIGVGAAVRSVLETSSIDPAHIALASLSTTLATNALVEGQGGRVALIYIGFRERDLEAHGLADALKGDPHIVLEGGHDHAGNIAKPLDEAALAAFLEGYGDEVSAFAVAGQFAVRNPGHELRAMEMIAQATGRPVSASHQLSAKLGGPKRAMTALLNARLLGMIDRLIGRAESTLRACGIVAPMMVVRGDGALISADQAREKPIETILSGPAASIVGAGWLTGAADAMVSDIGGTTTDVALLRDGRPTIDPDGARVGAYRTMVEAVAMRTTGLGGDSEIHIQTEGLKGGVTLGPKRLVPLSLIAVDAPDVVLPALEQQLRAAVPNEHDGRFLRRVEGVNDAGLSERDRDLLTRIGTATHPQSAILRSRMDITALRRLVARGLVQIAGATPSDASHVLGKADAWNEDAARAAMELLARRRIGTGEKLAQSAEQMARIVVDQLTHQTGIALLETAFAEEAEPFGETPQTLARHVLMQRGLSAHRGVMRVDTGLAVPVIGLGASARSYYPAVGDLMGSEMILPAHGGVANAIGAVVGRITMRRAGTVTAQGEGRYRVHLDGAPQDFSDENSALAHLEALLRTQAETAAQQARAEDVQIETFVDRKVAQIEAREVFVEAVVTVQASGRPRIALQST